jgi:hypothetical protein
MRLHPLALAAALALAATAAGAGNVSYGATSISISIGGQARSLNDEGEVAVWAWSSSAGGYVPRVWNGGTVSVVIGCCAVSTSDEMPLYIDNAGRVFGQAALLSGDSFGIALDRSTGFSAPLAAGVLPTGRAPDGLMLATVGSAGAVVNGNTVTPLPLPSGATQAWGHAMAGGQVVGKVAIGGLGYAASFRDGVATLLHNGPSVAYDVNANGQWAGFIGAGFNTQAVVGGPGGLVVLQGPETGLNDKVAIAINSSGQVLAGDGALNAPTQPTVSSPYLYGNGRATRLADLVPIGVQISTAIDMNEHGQILANGGSNPMLLTPQGTLSWVATAGGSFHDAAQWDSGLGFAPNKFLDVRLDSAASQTIWHERDSRMLSFSMGSGTGRVTLALERGALLRSDSSFAIEANGVLAGDGRVQTTYWLENRGRIAASNLTVTVSGGWVDGAIYNYGLISGLAGDGSTVRAGSIVNATSSSSAGVLPARMRVDAGQSLRLEAEVTNFGAIEVFGGTFSHAAGSALVTAATDLGDGNVVQGRILARDATLRFDTGLVLSGGQMAFSGGVSDVFGRVELVSPGVSGEPEGQVIVSGRAAATFWDAVKNNGELRVSAGSTATFFGLVSGSGRFTGAGTKFLEGGFAPGSSPAIVLVEGDLTMGASSPLLMELGGTTPGTEHDQVQVQGLLTLGGGPLQVVWWNGYAGSDGDRFDLLDWGALSGSFGSVSLPVLNDGLIWDTSGLYTLGELRVVAVPEPATWLMLLCGLTALRRISGGPRPRRGATAAP